MPNHVTNQIMVQNDDANHTKLLELAIFLKPDDGKLGEVDFNKLLPMPEDLNIEAGSRGVKGLKLYSQFIKESTMLSIANMEASKSEDETNRLVSELMDKYAKIADKDPEAWELGEKYYNNLQKYGARHWYDWANKHWQTKWNAYDCVPWEEGSDRLQFCTAWNSVLKLVSMLSEKFPKTEIIYRWADEELGYNVGELVIKDGFITTERFPIAGSKEAYELSADIVGISLEEAGLVFSEAEGAYRYGEDLERYEAPKDKKSKKRAERER